MSGSCVILLSDSSSLASRTAQHSAVHSKGLHIGTGIPLLHILRWKVLRVTPIPKDVKSAEVLTHQPITILSVFGKLFESVIYCCLVKQISNPLDAVQNGFCEAGSTVINICFLITCLDILNHADKWVRSILISVRPLTSELTTCCLKSFQPWVLIQSYYLFAYYLKNRRCVNIQFSVNGVFYSIWSQPRQSNCNYGIAGAYCLLLQMIIPVVCI